MPFIPITSVYTAFLIMMIIFPLYHLGSKSNTYLKSTLYFQQTAHKLLLFKTAIAIVLMAFAELNGFSIQVLHIFGLSWCLCIMYKVWMHLSQKTYTSHVHLINNITSFIIVCLCVMNFIISWPFFSML